MSSKSFWVKRQEKVFGPFAYEKIAAGFKAGKVTQNDSLSESQSGPWTTIKTLLIRHVLAGGDNESLPPLDVAFPPRKFPPGKANRAVDSRPTDGEKLDARADFDSRLGLKIEWGEWVCPRCGSNDTYQGTVKQYAQGPTFVREVGDSGMYMGATAGRHVLVSQTRCRNCGEDLYWDDHYQPSDYEDALWCWMKMRAFKKGALYFTVLWTMLIVGWYLARGSLIQHEQDRRLATYLAWAASCFVSFCFGYFIYSRWRNYDG